MFGGGLQVCCRRNCVVVFCDDNSKKRSGCHIGASSSLPQRRIATVRVRGSIGSHRHQNRARW